MHKVKRMTERQKAAWVRRVEKKYAGSDIMVKAGQPFRSVPRNMKPLPSLGCMVPGCTGCKLLPITLEQAMKEFAKT